MPADANLVLQASATKTATFNGTALDLKTGTPRRGLKARIKYSAANTSSGAGAVTFTVQHSDDNSTFTDCGDHSLTLSTTAQAGVAFIPFETSKRYVRLAITAISGTGATVTYYSDVMLARP